jgi:hypothetical protein
MACVFLVELYWTRAGRLTTTGLTRKQQHLPLLTMMLHLFQRGEPPAQAMTLQELHRIARLSIPIALNQILLQSTRRRHRLRAWELSSRISSYLRNGQGHDHLRAFRQIYQGAP